MKSRFCFLSCVACAFLFLALPILLSCDDISAPDDTSVSDNQTAPEWWNDTSGGSAVTSAPAADAGYWTKALGAPDKREELEKMVRTSDGGYVVLAENNQSGDWLFKIDGNGAMIWQKNISVGLASYINAIAESPDGGVFVCGNYHHPEMDSYQDDDFLLKLDAGGNQVWIKSYNITNMMNFSQSMAALPDGSVVVAGYIEAGNANYWDMDITLMKAGPAGDLLWVKKLAGTGVVADYPGDMAVTADGNIVLVGTTDGVCDSNGVPSDEAAMIVKISPSGDLLWNRVYAYTGDLKYPGVNLDTVQPASDGGFIATGEIRYKKGRSAYEDRDLIERSDEVVLKCDRSGKIVWSKRFRNMLSVTGVSANVMVAIASSGYEDDVNAAIQTADGGYVLQGQSTGYSSYLLAGIYDYLKIDRAGWLMKMTSTGKVSWIKGYRDAFREGTSDEFTPNGYRKANTLVLGSVRAADNNDLVAGGSIRQGQGDRHDVLLMKTDSQGAISANGILTYNNFSPTYVDTCIASAGNDMTISDVTAGAVIDLVLTMTDTDAVVTGL